MILAAGILLLCTKTGRALFLKRGNGGDMPGTWCFPGGRVEQGESTMDAAIRETIEEAGFKAKGLKEWTRSTDFRDPTSPTPSPDGSDLVDFTTFVAKVDEEFTPTLNDEVTAFAWAPVAEPPEPLHPGCLIALARFKFNELDIANAMIAGQLTSPQEYGGFTLFNIRITGTGVAFRARKLGEKTKDKKKRVDANGYEIVREEEYPVRDPALYLTQEFLDRCNGLPVVLEHPPGQKITGEEFNLRTIGTVFKPYIRGEEVWAIAKVYDPDAVELMSENQLSTSPGVVWGPQESVGVEAILDGKRFLFESKPSLMDHIAVCHRGVWDKGGPPSGVETARKDAIDMDKSELEKMLAEHRASTDTAIKTVLGAVEGLAGTVGKITARMDADDEEKEKAKKDKARKDAEDFKFGSRKDGEDDKAFKDRRDAEENALCDMYKACGDSEDEAKEKAAKDRKDADEADEKERKDAEEKAEKERKDAAARIATDDVNDLRKRLEAAEKVIKERVPEVQPRDLDTAAFAQVQSRFDDVYVALGMKTPVPMQGESLLNYRRRGLLELKKHSKTYKDAELGVAINDEAVFSGVESTILREASEIARTDASVPPGTLRAVERTLPSGHKETTFLGHASDWMSEFGTARQFAKIYPHNANGHRSGSAA